jgi:hypoxanthine-DNA glycosylase
MPGVLSIAKRQYYANPRNHFWRIIYAVLGGGDPPTTYQDRVQFLRNEGVALWDVMERCEREGSSDASIVKGELNDFSGLFATRPNIKTIFFNGKKAHETFIRSVPTPDGVMLLCLPSTSPANAAIPMPRRLELWNAVSEALRRDAP